MTSDNTPVIKELELLGYGQSYKREIATMLEGIPAFAELSHNDIELLADVMHAYRAPARVIIFAEGKRDPYLCFVVEGKLDIFKEAGETNNKRHLTSVKEGKVLGEMSFIDNQPHSATVVTATPVVVLLLTKMGLERLGEHHPRIAFLLMKKLAELLSHRLRQTTGQLIERL